MNSDNQTSRMPQTGKICFFLGIIIGLIAAAKPPLPEEKFPNTLMPYLFALLASGLGVWLWRRQAKQAAAPQQSAETGKARVPGQSTGSIASLLAALQKAADEFATVADEVNAENYLERLTQLIRDFVEPAVEARTQFIEKLGLEQGALRNSELAYAERMLNRAWSAKADGDHQEAKASLEEARAAIASLVLSVR